MPDVMFLCKSGIWPILCQLMAILANLLDMHFKFVFNFDTQTNFEVNQTQISVFILLVKGGGGVQAFHFGKNDFELGVGGDGQDTSRHFEGSFRSIRAILPM